MLLNQKNSHKLHIDEFVIFENLVKKKVPFIFYNDYGSIEYSKRTIIANDNCHVE